MNELTIIAQTDETTMREIVDMVLDGLNPVHSERSYEKALEDFLYWWSGEGKPSICKVVVQKYKTLLLDKGLSASTINIKLAAISKLMHEAADNGLIDPVQAAGIAKIKGVRYAGVRSGNWLNRSQAQALINAPDITSLKLHAQATHGADKRG
ncbi:MAG TPA: site-specific integrase [Anaerolineales bacterium]